MADDPDEYVAMMFHGLVSELQANDVSRFDAELKRDREARAALRQQDPKLGMNAGELLKKMDGDPADVQRKIQDDLAKTSKDALAAAVAKDPKNEPLPIGHFPPPPTSG
jgi:hypothetical protein